jgi:hypothetical protein
MIIGLDTDNIPIRLIYADPENSSHTTPHVLESRAFRNANSFCKYWTRLRARTPNLVVAVADVTEDPLGLIPWLISQKANLEVYPWLSYYKCHLKGDFEEWGLPKAFEQPFALALYATYRLQGPLVAHRLWTQISIAQGMLTEIRHGLYRLGAALPESSIFETDKEGNEQLTLPF